MQGTPKLGEMECFAGGQFIDTKFIGFRGTKNSMVVRINGLWNPKIRTALAHGFQITVKTFVLCHEKPDDLPGGIVNGAMEGISDGAAKPFVRGGIDLDELTGMRFSFAPMGAVADFFLFGAFKTSIF